MKRGQAIERIFRDFKKHRDLRRCPGRDLVRAHTELELTVLALNIRVPAKLRDQKKAQSANPVEKHRVNKRQNPLEAEAGRPIRRMDGAHWERHGANLACGGRNSRNGLPAQSLQLAALARGRVMQKIPQNLHLKQSCPTRPGRTAVL